MHSGVNWAGLKLLQVLAQQVQALICWVIAIEPEASIARVVVPAVKVLHQLDCSMKGSGESSHQQANHPHGSNRSYQPRAIYAHGMTGKSTHKAGVQIHGTEQHTIWTRSPQT